MATVEQPVLQQLNCWRNGTTRPTRFIGDAMESFSRGWSFLKQAWQMAFKDKDLLKPSIYALIAGMIVSVIGIIPIMGAVFLFGGSRLGNIILFVMGGVMIFVQFMVSYIFSA